MFIMQHNAIGKRICSRSILLGALLFACTSSASKSKTKPPAVTSVGTIDGAPSDTLAVDIEKIHNDLGSVRCSLYDNGEGFPRSEKHIIAKAVARPMAGKAMCQFVGLHRDRDYAIVMIHDEDNDGTLATGHFGIPTEGYGFSNNVHPRFSAPSFDDCKFHFMAGAKQISIAPIY